MQDRQSAIQDISYHMLNEQLSLDMPGPDFREDSKREYRQSHPWLTFALDLQQAPPRLWMLLGEAKSKCEALGRIPMPQHVAEELHRVYLVKGVQGTTAIEGNTLSEEQVRKILDGKLELPPSQEYLRKEVENIIGACEAIVKRAVTGKGHGFSYNLICAFNKLVLNNLEVKSEVTPGKVRTYSVGVARYLGAPYQDCQYLLQRLCSWLNEMRSHSQSLGDEIIRAIIAHLYLAWIHPFGDGNGRTARLMEFHILVNAGVPTPAAHLLSNHYNLTRSKYLETLDQTSKSGGKVAPFVQYALEGFVEQLREQIMLVSGHQVQLAWKDFINEQFAESTSATDIRRRDLLHALSWRPAKRANIRTLNQRIEKEYRDKTDKTITRDLNWLVERKLVKEEGGVYAARSEMIFGFLPERAKCKLKQDAEEETRITQNLITRFTQKPQEED
jgi:Fic family protein